MSLRVTLRAWSIPLGPRTVVAEQAVAPDGARKPRYARQRAPRENGGSFGRRSPQAGLGRADVFDTRIRPMMTTQEAVQNNFSVSNTV